MYIYMLEYTYTYISDYSIEREREREKEKKELEFSTRNLPSIFDSSKRNRVENVHLIRTKKKIITR